MTIQAESREPPGRPVTVFLLDDHEVVRRGVRDLLEAHPDITVVGEAGTASSALARIRRCARTWPCSTFDCQTVTGNRVSGDPLPDAGGSVPDADLVRR